MCQHYIESTTVLSDMLVDEEIFESYLAIDSPFQTFAVGLLVEFLD